MKACPVTEVVEVGVVDVVVVELVVVDVVVLESNLVVVGGEEVVVVPFADVVQAAAISANAANPMMSFFCTWPPGGVTIRFLT